MKQIFLIASFSLLMACSETTTPGTFEGLKVPSNFETPTYLLADNPVTKNGFELGRKLFYDPLLSRNNTISCADCHNQGSAFTHHGHDLSHGIDDLIGRRNALPIQNLLWQKNTFFWDGGVHNIDLIPLNAIQNPVEMDEVPAQIVEKLKAHPQYPKLFKQAFGSEGVTSTRMLQSLAQFMAMLISADSKFDKFIRGETGGTFTAAETEGYALFQQKCSTCHAGMQFSSYGFANNGLRLEPTTDLGRYEISLLTGDEGKFRIPSLRNIGFTPPYMHDGSMRTLETVLEHYNSGVQNATTLDPRLKQNGQLGIPLNTSEKEKIIAFLNTLNDETFIRNPLFAAP